MMLNCDISNLLFLLTLCDDDAVLDLRLEVVDGALIVHRELVNSLYRMRFRVPVAQSRRYVGDETRHCHRDVDRLQRN